MKQRSLTAEGWLVQVTGAGPDKRFITLAHDEREAIASVSSAIELRGGERFNADRHHSNEFEHMRPGEVHPYA